jgi:hypothetical protein
VRYDPAADTGERSDRNKASGATAAKLYNLAQDIGETTDLAARNPDKLNELDTAWKQWSAQQARPLWGPGSRGSAQEEE